MVERGGERRGGDGVKDEVEWNGKVMLGMMLEKVVV